MIHVKFTAYFGGRGAHEKEKLGNTETGYFGKK